MKGLAFKLYRLAICHSGRFRIGPTRENQSSFKKKGYSFFFNQEERDRAKNESFAIGLAGRKSHLLPKIGGART